MKTTIEVEIGLISGIFLTNSISECVDVPMSIIGDIINDPELDEYEQTEKIINHIKKNYKIDSSLLKRMDIELATKIEDDKDVIKEIEEKYEKNWSCIYDVDIEKIVIDYDDLNDIQGNEC